MLASNKEHVLATALRMAEENGLFALRRDDIAKRAKVSAGTVSGAFEGMENLIDMVILRAIETKNHLVIADAIVRGNKRALSLSREEKRKALMAII